MEDKHGRLANRLASILILALGRERLDVASLAEKLSVSIKTVRRDLARLGAVLEETEQTGTYRLVSSSSSTYLDKDIDHLINDVGLSKAIPIRKNQFIQHILRDTKEQYYHFKESSIEDLKHHSDYFIVIEAAIEERRNISFIYNNKKRTVAPYLMIISHGIWYLVSGIWYLVSGIWYLVSGIFPEPKMKSLKCSRSVK